jgi:hypothetical protein
MSWWRRVFGRGARPAPPALAVPIPAYREPIPGQLAVRIYAHELRAGGKPVPCWSYVTDGLRALDHPEIVFTLRRRPGEEAFPEGPLPFLASLARHAEEGGRLDPGSSSALDPAGRFLGIDGPVGMAYAPAETLPGVNYPDRPLAALLLLGDEVEARNSVGTTRLLALLGMAERCYPYPPWADRDRPTVLTRDDVAASLLSQTPTAFLGGAAVRLPLDREEFAPGLTAPPGGSGVVTTGPVRGRLVLRVAAARQAELRQLIDRAPAEAAFALLLAPDPRANVRLVWRPGQDGVRTIFPHTDAGRADLTGGFLLLAPYPDAVEGGRIVEDGFALQLQPATWARLREALRDGRPFTLPAAGAGLDFTLHWERRGGPAELVRGLLYQPEEVLRQRLADTGSFAAYVERVREETEEYFADVPPGDGQALTLVLAVRPGREARYWSEYHPGGLADGVADGLRRRLAGLAAPTVRGGPVAHALHFYLWGGPDQREPSPFASVPKQWQEAMAGSDGVLPDAPLARIWC